MHGLAAAIPAEMIAAETIAETYAQPKPMKP